MSSHRVSIMSSHKIRDYDCLPGKAKSVHFCTPALDHKSASSRNISKKIDVTCKWYIFEQIHCRNSPLTHIFSRHSSEATQTEAKRVVRVICS